MERKEREHIRQEWVEKQEKIKSKHCYIVTSPRYHQNCPTWQKILIPNFLSIVTLVVVNVNYFSQSGTYNLFRFCR